MCVSQTRQLYIPDVTNLSFNYHTTFKHKENKYSLLIKAHIYSHLLTMQIFSFVTTFYVWHKEKKWKTNNGDSFYVFSPPSVLSFLFFFIPLGKLLFFKKKKFKRQFPEAADHLQPSSDYFTNYSLFFHLSEREN